MGRRSKTGGVTAKGDRIQFDFMYRGERRRPTIDQAPTQTNLKNARRRMQEILKAIRDGAFDFAAEFPDYKHLGDVSGASAERTVTDACAAFIASLRARGELAFATVESYRKILANRIEAEHGTKPFASITYSQLEKCLPGEGCKKKTFNNVASAIREAWAHGYKDLPGRTNPALGIKGVRIPKREQPKPDPFPIDEAELVIAETLRLWGEDQRDYEEGRFFTGLRPSEQIALTWPDFDDVRGELAVNKARVMARDKDEPKNYEDRVLELCPRALAVFRRRRVRWSALKLAGKIDHDRIFFREDGQPFHDLQVQWKRWRRTMAELAKRAEVEALRIRARDPYNARHSSVSWNLMMGKNLLWVAEQHGHSAAVMLKTYAKWMRGATEADVAKIREAFGYGSESSVPHRPEERGAPWDQLHPFRR